MHIYLKIEFDIFIIYKFIINKIYILNKIKY